MNDPDAGLLRYDGLYVRVLDKVWRWLRFDAEGTVLSVSTTEATAEQVARWLRVGHPGASAGQWSLDGTRLAFVTSSEYGAVEYEGEARGASLHLALRSRINRYRDEGAWDFCALTGGPPP